MGKIVQKANIAPSIFRDIENADAEKNGFNNSDFHSLAEIFAQAFQPDAPYTPIIGCGHVPPAAKDDGLYD